MKIFLSALLALFSLHGVTQAALIDRGGGLIYDEVLNITWLQDANYAKTSGYSTELGGRMSWDEAKTWTDDLTFGGYDDWRLPSVAPINGTAFYFNFFDYFSGKADRGLNIGAPGTAYEGAISSEMAHMFYVNLGLKSIANPDGTFNPDYGIFGDGTIDLEGDVGLVRNLQPEMYWSGTALPNFDNSKFSFNFQLGEQDVFGKFAGPIYAWAVRDGDVAIATAQNGVPEPGTLGLLALGIAGLGLARRRR